MTSFRPRFRFPRLARDEAGAAAAEFALIVPGLALMTVGVSWLMMAMWASATLHFATEDAARCASVNPTVCTNTSTTQTYAAGRYKGPGTPTFTASTPSCGKKVDASLAYTLRTGIGTIAVPMNATACYPLP